MSERELKIPAKKAQEQVEEEVKETETVEEQPTAQTEEEEKLTQEEADYIEKVFFEDDDIVRLRDGKSYRIPPLGLKDAKNLMKKLNSIDTGVIIANMIEDENGEDSYDELLEVLLLGFKPYYKEMTVDYLADYVDIGTAKVIIDTLIGLNGLKKSL